MGDERVVGQVTVGTKIALEVVDLGDDLDIEIRWADNPQHRIRIPKQSAHVLADVLRDVDVKYRGA